jgi:hypothetical protein
MVTGGSIYWVVSDTRRVQFAGVDTGSWTNNNTVSGGTLATGRTFLAAKISERCRQDGLIKQVKGSVNVVGVASGWKFKVFRPNGSNYDFVSESELITPGGTGTQTFTLATPMACQPGDVLGVWLKGDATTPATVNIRTITATASIVWLAGDNTGTNQNFTNTIDNDSLNLMALGQPPFAVDSGDSIIAGHNTASPWETFYDTSPAGPVGTLSSEFFHQIRGLMSPSALEYQNHAMGGQTYSWVNSTAIKPAVMTRAKAVVIHCGINDIVAARTWNQVSADLDAIKYELAPDQHLFIDEILPRTASSDADSATIRTFNTNLATWCGSNGATLISCHDVMAQTRVSTGQLDDLLAAYDYDGTHVTQAGVDKVASLIKAALDTYYPHTLSFSLVAFDPFTDANSTAVGSHTMYLGNGWTVQSGAIVITSNKAVASGTAPGGPQWVATIATSYADCTTSVVINVTTGTGTYYGLALRYSDNNNMWWAIAEGGGTFAIFERNAGTNTLRASASLTITAGTNYTIQAVLSGSTITATINGGNQISYGSATLNQTANTHGIRLGDANGTIDNFTVTV